MPERKIVGPFTPKSDFNKAEYIRKNVEETRTLVYAELDEALSIKNRAFRHTCLFSVIDCFAQEYANYPTNNATKVFNDFVLTFQDCCDYLELIEPITLFYEYESEIKQVIKYPELHNDAPELCMPVKEVSLEDFGILDGKNVSEIIKSGKSEEFLSIIERDKGSKEADRYRKKHMFIQLIYKMRSKAVHELSRLGSENKWEIEDGCNQPFYRELSRLYKQDMNIVNDRVYELIIPSKFIYTLAKNTIDNYLSFCIREQKLPFENNSNFQRQVSITWVG